MTNADLGVWADSGVKLETQNAGTKADYTIPDVLDKIIKIESLDIENVGQYKGCVFNIRETPTSEVKTLYSSSKVLNEQIVKLLNEKQDAFLVQIKKVKNYYSI